MTTTQNLTVMPSQNASRLVAQEIRAELGRQGQSARQLAAKMNRTQHWISARLSPTAKVDMTVDEIAEMAAALDVPASKLLAVWLADQPNTLVRSYLTTVADVVDLSVVRASRLARAS